MAQHTEHSRSETGAVLVHAVVVLMGLMAFSTFVVDYGVLWAARRQAQNAADAGALAGAVAMLYDTQLIPLDALPAAKAVAETNRVWAEVPVVESSVECPSYTPPTVLGLPDCIQVDVFRDALHGNPLPMFFGSLVGRTHQGVRATATARVTGANASRCLKPWALADQYLEYAAPSGQFNPGDGYTPPNSTSVGTGYAFAQKGTSVVLTVGQAIDPPKREYFRAVILSVGGGAYSHDISYCNGVLFGIGDTLTAETADMVAPTDLGVSDLIARDPGAAWNSVSNVITGSCAANRTCTNEDGTVDPSITVSPRVVAVPVYDPGVFDTTGVIKVVNILGFFVTGPGSVPGEVAGVLCAKPDLIASGKGTVGDLSAFVKAVTLVR